MFLSSLAFAGGNAVTAPLGIQRLGEDRRLALDSRSTDLLVGKESNQRSRKWNSRKQVEFDGQQSSNCCILIEHLSVDIPLQCWHGA